MYCILYIVKDRPVLSSERAPHIKTPQWSDSKKNLVISPRWGLDTKTDLLTDCQSQYDFDFDLKPVRVEFQDASLPGRERESRGTELAVAE
jgi:hypothetical protein